MTVTKQGHPGEADVGKLNPSAKDGNNQLGYSEVQSPSRSVQLQAPTTSAEGQVGFEPSGLQTGTQPQSPGSPGPPKPHTDPPSPVDFVPALSQVLPFYAQQQQKSSVASTPTKAKLAAFSGDSALSWEPYFCHMRMVQKVNSWSDLQLVQEFGCKLQGKALEYYYTLEPSCRETDLTYVDKAMQRRFGDLTHPAALRSQLENLKQAQDQTLEDLAAHVRKLAYRVCADESPTSRETNAVRWFIQAIASEQVKQMLFLPPGPSTIPEALELASHIRDMRSTYVRPASKTLGVRQAQIEVPDNATQPDSDVTALRHWVRYFVENSFQTQHRRTASSKVRAETECWFCHKKGHWVRECYQKPQNWPDWLKVLWSAHEWSEAAAAENLTHPKEVEQILKEIQKLKDQLGQEAKERSDVG